MRKLFRAKKHIVEKEAADIALKEANAALKAFNKTHPESHFDQLTRAMKHINEPGKKELPSSDKVDAVKAFYYLAGTLCDLEANRLVHDVHHQNICKWADEVKKNPTLPVPPKQTDFVDDYRRHISKEMIKRHGLSDCNINYTP